MDELENYVSKILDGINLVPSLEFNVDICFLQM